MIEGLLSAARRRTGLRVEDGLQILSADALLVRPFDPGWPVLLLPGSGAPPAATDGDGFRPGSLPGRGVHARDPIELLSVLYPAEHATLALGEGSDRPIGALAPADLGVARLIPGVDAVANLASPHALPWLAARLRAPDGCPWDREQTHASLKKFLLEESYEVYDALDAGATPALVEELGDLLLQVVLHAEYAAEAHVFDLTDVYRGIMAKIVRRHPHVFGDVEARSVDQVMRNWEQIKEGERLARTEAAAASADVPAAFAGLSRSLPALSAAQEMQERAASVGYDWPDVTGVIDKIAEEAHELAGATDPGERREEFGDLLFVLVNLARKLDVDAEAAVRAAGAKYARRFLHVERLAAERALELRALGLDALDELWQEVKLRERGALEAAP